MSEGESVQALDALVASKFNEMLLANYCSVAATMLLFYDFALTFARELECIWGRKISGASVLFLLNRYLTLLNRILLVINMLPWQNEPETTADKVSVVRSSEVLTIILGLVIAAFTALRMFAIWSGNLKVLVALAVLGVVPPAVNIYYYTTLYILSSPRPFSGCGEIIGMSARAIANFNCIYPMVYDALVLVLTWAKTYQTNCASSKFHMKNSLTSLIQRDGTIYFFVLLLLNAINLVAIKFEILGSVPALTDVLTSIMVSRFFLDLRGVYLSSTSGSQSISGAQSVPEVISLDFTSSLTGNLGAPLNGWFDEVPDSFSADEPPPAYEWHEPMLLHLRPEADDSDGSDSPNELGSGEMC